MKKITYKVDMDQLKVYIKQKEDANKYIESFKTYIMSLINGTIKRHYVYNIKNGTSNLGDIELVFYLGFESNITSFKIDKDKLDLFMSKRDYDWEDNPIIDRSIYSIPISVINDKDVFYQWFLDEMKRKKALKKKRKEDKERQEYLRLKAKFEGGKQ